MPLAKNKLKGLLYVVFLLALLGGIIFYFNTFHVNGLEKFLIDFDRLGVTPAGRSENERRASIENLNIDRAQRDALINRTIFFGADKTMVELALGKPVSITKSADNTQDVWLYYFDDYTSPTYLYFKNNVLSSAEKASN